MQQCLNNTAPQQQSCKISNQATLHWHLFSLVETRCSMPINLRLLGPNKGDDSKWLNKSFDVGKTRRFCRNDKFRESRKLSGLPKKGKKSEKSSPTMSKDVKWDKVNALWYIQMW